MSTTAPYPHIEIDATGVARLEGTRYKVLHLAAEHYQHGWSAEELLRQHPDLRPEQVYVALGYFYDHYDALVSEMHRSVEAADRARNAQALSRDELLRRGSGG